MKINKETSCVGKGKRIGREGKEQQVSFRRTDRERPVRALLPSVWLKGNAADKRGLYGHYFNSTPY